MSAAAVWARAIVQDAVMLFLFYWSRVIGEQSAEDLVVFWLWFVAICGVLAGLIGNKTHVKEQIERSAGFAAYQAITNVMFVSLLVWLGYLWLPSLYLLGALGLEAARKREPKTKEVDNGR